jgi:hypothetical protein
MLQSVKKDFKKILDWLVLILLDNLSIKINQGSRIFLMIESMTNRKLQAINQW